MPTDLLVDLRLFLTGSTEVDVYLKNLSYDATADVYTLTFSDTATSTTLLTGQLSRLFPSGQTRVFKKATIAAGIKVALFTPGKLWDTPDWNGGGDWSKDWTPTESAIETSLVNPGPKTFRRIFIDGLPIPDEVDWPYGGTQRLTAGYNLQFGGDEGRIPSFSFANPELNGVVDLVCAPGLGLGFPPLPDVGAIDYLATFNSQGPDNRGNINITPQDCLRLVRPRLEDGTPIPHRLQFASDCAPCCPCSEYLHVSRSIGRRSAKLKDLCNDLNDTKVGNATVYNDAVAEINAKRHPLVVVRNVRALGSHIIFTVQNMTDIPLFAYVAFNVVEAPHDFGSIALTQDNVVSVNQSGVGTIYEAVENDRFNLPRLPFQESENPSATFPTLNFTSEFGQILLCVGEYTQSNHFSAISPGGMVEVNLFFPTVEDDLEGLTDPDDVKSHSIAGMAPVLKFRSATVYGASLSYGCATDLYQCKIVEIPTEPDPFVDRCDTPFANHFRAVPV